MAPDSFFYLVVNPILGAKCFQFVIGDQSQKLFDTHKAMFAVEDWRSLSFYSLPGIGPITAVYLLGCTANFAAKPSGKQLACYAGLAPFAHTSGTSIRGKPKVHKMANKELKTLLHQGARSVIQHNAELRQYYERKIGEGKHDLSAVNAIKNKIVLRVAAVINHQKPYVDYTKVAAQKKCELALV